MKCAEMIGRPEFELDDVYAFEGKLAAIIPTTGTSGKKSVNNCKF
jgi:hypothetical protein